MDGAELQVGLLVQDVVEIRTFPTVNVALESDGLLILDVWQHLGARHLHIVARVLPGQYFLQVCPALVRDLFHFDV